jgi:hypothetical protein
MFLKVFKFGVIMILKVSSPCLTLGAYSRCMNVVEGACKSSVYFVESTWDALVLMLFKVVYVNNVEWTLCLCWSGIFKDHIIFCSLQYYIESWNHLFKCVHA